MTIPTLDRLRSLEGRWGMVADAERTVEACIARPFGSLTATAADLLRIAEASAIRVQAIQSLARTGHTSPDGGERSGAWRSVRYLVRRRHVTPP